MCVVCTNDLSYDQLVEYDVTAVIKEPPPHFHITQYLSVDLSQRHR